MRKQRINRVYIQHNQDAIQKIATYLTSHTHDDFIQNDWDQDAISRNLEIIGEAANNLEASFRDRFSEVPWRKIIDFRNVVVHDYADLDLEVVWQIITEYLPKLSPQINDILKHENRDEA